MPAHGRRGVQLLAHDAQPGVGNLAAQPGDADLLEQVVLLLLAAPCRLDERVLVRRLLQRPGRVPRQEPEGRERRPASDHQVQRHLQLEPRQVRARKRQVRRRRQVDVAAWREHARALAQVQRRVGHVLDDGVRQHQIESAAARTADPCRRPARRSGARIPRSRPSRTPASWNRSAGSMPTTSAASSASDSGMPPPPHRRRARGPARRRRRARGTR